LLLIEFPGLLESAFATSFAGKVAAFVEVETTGGLDVETAAVVGGGGGDGGGGTTLEVVVAATVADGAIF
jgi:hypothetical protein